MYTHAVLSATFLGHQGWLLSTATTHVLVDPLLGDGFGHGGLAGRVFPPRTIEVEALPRLDAVFITHEHDDHFDIPSLSRIDRTVPVFVSSRSSLAMRDCVAELGFAVELLHPEATVTVGDLSYRTFVADHRASPLADEWDVFAYLVTDGAGQGAFASSVDVAMPEAMIEALASTPGWPGILCLANNTTDTRFVQRGVGRIEPTDDTEALARVLARRWQHVARRAGAPTATVITGGGWSHPADVAWIDRIAFCVDPARLAVELASACSAPLSAVRPGDVLRLDPAGVERGRAGFIDCDAGSRRHPAQAVEVPDAFDPACGRRRLQAPDVEHLEQGLRDLARFWFGGPLFVAAHSLAITFHVGVVLRDEGQPRVYAYAPEATAFRPVAPEDPYETFASGLECWGTDLLGLFEGQIAPSALCYSGRLRCWNRDPDRLRVTPHELWRFAHPLHRPAAARRLYRRLVRATQRDRS